MILELIFGLIFGLVGLLVDLIGTAVPPVPGWFTSAVGQFSTLVSGLWQLDAWLPVGLMFSVATAVIAALVAGVVIGLVRWVASYFLGGGGTT